MKNNLHRIFSPSSPLLLVILILLIVGILIPLVLKFTWRQQSNLNQIQIENQLPGTTAWQLTDPAPFDRKTFRSPAIEGYAWTTSAEAGDAVKFSVSTTASSFTADVYRLGWYQGKGGRLVQSLHTISGHTYPLPKLDLQTGLIEATWPIAFTLKTGTTWVSGIYMVKLIASSGYQAYIPLVIRSSTSSNFAFIHAVNTDEAYNYWGGASLYLDLTHTLKANRAFKVSFDRPFEHGIGAGQFFWWEYPMVRWLEKRGYDISYFSDVDMQNNLIAHQYHHALLIVGHSEYWSMQMRNNLQALVDRGVNVAIFGGNSIYWQIRYEPNQVDRQAISEHIIVCYKDKYVDPLYGKDNSLVSVLFQDRLVNKPEQSLLGSMYGGSLDLSQPGFPWVVADASSWVFAGTGLKNGDSLPGLVGSEYDKVSMSYPIPPGLDILSVSPVINHLKKRDVSNATLYTALSGAHVFNAGTFQWSWGLDPSSPMNKTKVVSQVVQKITDNILENFEGRL